MEKIKLQHTLVTIHMPDRHEQANEVQTILTKYGCNIRTRIGLHQVSDDFCATNGLVLLEMYGQEKNIKQMVKDLKAIDKNMDVQQLLFKLKNNAKRK